MSTDLKPATVLAAAAAKLRATATEAHGGPWAVGEVGSPSVWSADVQPYGAPCVANRLREGDAEWIALVHPGLSEPLAEWLESEAHMCDVRPGNSAEGHTFHALKVARVILGETTGQAS